jgi:hypothetical protein
VPAPIPNDPAVAQAIHHKHVEQRQQHRSRKRRIQIIVASFVAAILAVVSIGVFASYRLESDTVLSRRKR